MAIATRLQNPVTMTNTVGYEGFSWTCFFFGPFPALFRGDVLGFAAMTVTALFTMGLSGLIWMFVYNGWHYNRLLARGYQPAGFVSLSNNITINNDLGGFAPARSEQDMPGRSVTLKPSVVPHTTRANATLAATGFGKRQ